MRNLTQLMLVFAMLILPIIFITGCDDPKEIARDNKDSISNPETVATMPDGRTLHCIKIERFNGYPHYGYYFTAPTGVIADTSTTSVNFEAQSGKTHYNQTIIIQGQTFELVPKP